MLSLLLAFAGVFAIGGPAQATVAGQIDGHVTDTTLAPGSIFLDGLLVELWNSGGFVDSMTTAGGGYFSFIGLPDETYYLYINGGSDYMDLETADFVFDSTTPASGDRGDINVVNAVHLTGTVRDPDGTPIQDVGVIAEGQPSGDFYLSDGVTDATGAYSVKIPGGEEYSLYATEIPGGYWDQIYTHLAITCGCAIQPVTEVVVALNDPDKTGLDFELHPYTDVQFDMLVQDSSGPGGEVAGLTIHLYKKVTGGYQEVEPGTTHGGLYDKGYATSYGPGAGDFRLRFSIGSTYVPVDGWYDFISSTGGPAAPGPVCYIDFNGLLDSDALELEITYDSTPFSCGPEPAVVTPGGGGTSTPPKKRTTTFSGTFVTSTPTPTPSATPTSSPSPSSSPSSSPDPNETPVPTEPTSGPDFPWWIILIIVLVLGIIVTIIVIVRRR